MTPEFTGDLENDEWAAWYRLTPPERWRETQRLWQFYLSVGGSLDPEPDSQSPFDFSNPPSSIPCDVRVAVRFVYRGGV